MLPVVYLDWIQFLFYLFSLRQGNITFMSGGFQQALKQAKSGILEKK